MPDVTPPVYDVDPTGLDDDQHPTAAWTVGEHLDEATIAKLRELREVGMMPDAGSE